MMMKEWLLALAMSVAGHCWSYRVGVNLKLHHDPHSIISPVFEGV